MIPMIPHLSYAWDYDQPAADETPAQTWTRMYRQSIHARDRAEINAALTMPEVYPPEGVNPDEFSGQTSYQSIGYRGTNNLVNTLATALFSTTRSFFRLMPTQKGVKALLDQNPNAKPEELQGILMEWERQATDGWIRRGDHDKLITALSHVAIIGQACLWWDKPNDTFRVVPFQNYCVERTAGGDIQTLIIAERLRVIDLHKKLQEDVLADPELKLDSSIALYTRCRQVTSGKYEVEISVNDLPVDDKFTKSYKAKDLPFAVPFWNRLPDSSYGISLVDGLRGDLNKLNIIEEGQAKGVVSLLNWRTLVNPGGQTDIDDFDNTEPGQAIPGKPEDIAISVTGDPNIVQLLSQISMNIENRLGSAFLMEHAAFRQGDRVTAEEIRRIVGSLDKQYTGIYAAMAFHFQQPLARWMMDMAGLKLDDTLDLAIVTGLDALGRAEEVRALMAALQDLAMIAQLPEPIQARLKMQAVAQAIGAGHGVDLGQYMLSEDEFQQQQKEQQLQQLQMQTAAQMALQQGRDETVP